MYGQEDKNRYNSLQVQRRGRAGRSRCACVCACEVVASTPTETALAVGQDATARRNSAGSISNAEERGELLTARRIAVSSPATCGTPPGLHLRLTAATWPPLQSDFFERAAEGLTRREYLLGVVAAGEWLGGGRRGGVNR
jgi:hypothetical protein